MGHAQSWTDVRHPNVALVLNLMSAVGLANISSILQDVNGLEAALGAPAMAPGAAVTPVSTKEAHFTQLHMLSHILKRLQGKQGNKTLKTCGW